MPLNLNTNLRQLSSGLLKLKSFYSQLSLQRKISIPFVTLFLGMWTLGMLSLGAYLSQNLERKKQQELNAAAFPIANELKQYQQTLSLEARLLAESLKVQQATAQQKATVLYTNILPFKQSLSTELIKIVDRNGKVLADLRSRELRNAVLSDGEAIARAWEVGNFEGAIATQDRSATLLVKAAAITPSRDRSAVGVVLVGNTLDRGVLLRLGRGTQYELMAFHGQRLVASTFPQTYAIQGYAIPERGNTALTIANQTYLAKTVGIPGLERNELKLVVLSSLEPLQEAQQRLWIKLGWLCLGGALVTTAISYGIAAAIARRVKALTRATKKLAKGNLATRLSANSGDEVGQLAVAFNQMAEKLAVRDRALQQQMQQRDKALQELAAAQAQLVQREKMSSLGQLVGGIAHEINNPVSFIRNNLPYVAQYTQALLSVVESYQRYYPHPVIEVQRTIEKVELDFVTDDLLELLTSMKTGTDRISDIVLSLRNFSRLDESDLKPAKIHDGLESTLLILQHRLKQREIQVVKDYGSLPEVECYPGALNQVFMNILSNAIEAFESNNSSQRDATIWIGTELSDRNSIVRIRDNGAGIPPEICPKIFDPFFTTKPIGQGTGLGLAISYQIVVQQHGGMLTCESQRERGTEFTIAIPLKPSI